MIEKLKLRLQSAENENNGLKKELDKLGSQPFTASDIGLPSARLMSSSTITASA
jgi:peptidyl-tRNA hydrolase